MAGHWLPLHVSKPPSNKRKGILTRNRVKDNHLLKNGHKTRYWCCQDIDRKQAARQSEKEGVKHRDTVGMHCFNCKSKLHVSCGANPDDEDTRVVTIWLEHHIRHTPYYDVSLPPEASAMIRENLEWISPSEIAKKVQTTYPAITTNQVHMAWTRMSETLWKRDTQQLPSVQKLLGELQDDVDVLKLPEIDGVEQVAWVMKRVLLPLRGQVAEIGIDATCEGVI